MDPITQARWYKELVAKHGTQAAAARNEGINRSVLVKRLRLLELPQKVQDDIRSGILSIKHGLALLRIPGKWWLIESDKLRNMSANQALRWAEERARELREIEENNDTSKLVAKATPNPDHLYLEEQLRQKYQTRVKVRPLGDGCQITIDAFTGAIANDVFEKLLKG